MPSVDPDYINGIIPAPVSLGTQNLGVLDYEPSGVNYGDYYLNTSTGRIRIYNGSTWQDWSAYTNAAQTNIANTFTTGVQDIKTGNDVNVGLRVRQNSGTQSGNLTEWTNSGNTSVLASVSSAGVFTGSGAGLTNIFNADIYRAVNHFGSSSAENYSRLFANNTSGAYTNGRVTFMGFSSPVDMTISQISMFCVTAGVDIGGTTVRRMGLYTLSGSTYTLVARTASDVNLFTSANTLYTRSFDTTGGYPSTYSLTAGTRYFMAVICYNTGGTYNGPQFPCLANSTSAMTALSPVIIQQLATQTDLPTSTSSTANTTNILWGRAS